MGETAQSYNELRPTERLTTDWLREQLYERYVYCEYYDGDDYRLTVWYHEQSDKFTFRENTRTFDSKLIHEICNPQVYNISSYI